MANFSYAMEDISVSTGTTDQQVKNAINQYSSKGYRYVGYIPISYMGNGNLSRIKLVFEAS